MTVVMGIFYIVAGDVNVRVMEEFLFYGDIQYDRIVRISYSMLVEDRIARIFLLYDGHGDFLFRDVDVRVMGDFSILMAIHDRIIRGFSILC